MLAEINLKYTLKGESNVEALLRRLTILERKVKELRDAYRKVQIAESATGSQCFDPIGNPSSAIM